VIPQLHSELRKAFSTRLWWGLLIPVAMLSLLVNAFGAGLSGLAADFADGGDVPLLLLSMAFSLSLTGVFAAVFGAVAAGGEFRHRTITTSYLGAPGRVDLLVAKLAVAGLVGGLYGLVGSAVAVLAGALADPGRLPAVSTLLSVTAIGALVCALWAAFGAAVAVAVGNQVGALLLVLVYLLVGELLVSTLLTSSSDPVVAALSSYLPGNAGDVALYDLPARAVIGGYGPADELVSLLTAVSSPPPWWVGLVILSGWTSVVGALGALLGQRRDIT
jgi:ABC-type transport system involved in multi-copper enzyme maturation permease subunit